MRVRGYPVMKKSFIRKQMKIDMYMYNIRNRVFHQHKKNNLKNIYHTRKATKLFCYSTKSLIDNYS